MPETVDRALSLDTGDLLVAALLVVVAGVVSIALSLRLERRLAVASARTVLQLLIVGHVLRFVFRLERFELVLVVLLFMCAAAARAAVQRPTRTFRGAGWRAFGALATCGLATTFVVTAAVIGVEPWWSPRYAIPLLGMTLGNGLTGISLCLDQVLERLADRRDEVEMELAHGASRWEAAVTPLRESVRAGMIPILNAMTVVGIVSLPGMMTGQVLEGADPLAAVRYQVVVMFMIAGATSLGCVGIALLAYRHLFNDRHQLRVEAIVKKAG